MDRYKYTPFLKLKANEVAAIASLSDVVKDKIVPFFDLARKDGMSPAGFGSMVSKSAVKLRKYVGLTRPFFLDNYDIADDILLNGQPNYEAVMHEFRELNFVPVVGLNRTMAHNQAVFNAKASGRLKSGAVAIRLVEEDFESFGLIQGELGDLIKAGAQFAHRILVLDCRMCRNVDPATHAAKLASFISQATKMFDFSLTIVAGSSIPAAIGEIAKVDVRCNISRVELTIYRTIRAMGLDHVGFGDYTVVSPLYSDVTLPPEMMRTVTAPKVLYSYEDLHFIARGGALKTHARGNLQYNDLASEIVAQPFYRGAPYSFGDDFLNVKAKMGGKLVTPGSILNPTINAHITYMATGHPLLM